MENYFTSLLNDKIVLKGKMTFGEIKAYALRFYDEAALMRRAGTRYDSRKSVISRLYLSGEVLTESQHARLVNNGVNRKVQSFLTSCRREKKYQHLVVDRYAKEVRNELRK